MYTLYLRAPQAPALPIPPSTLHLLTDFLRFPHYTTQSKLDLETTASLTEWAKPMEQAHLSAI